MGTEGLGFRSVLIAAVGLTFVASVAAANCTPGSCDNACFAGAYAFSNLSENQEGVSTRRAEVGMLYADGATDSEGYGHVTGVIKGAGLSSGYVSTETIAVCSSTRYKILADCTGSLDIDVDTAGLDCDAEFDSLNMIVLEDGGKGLRALKTSGNVVVLGFARALD